MKAVIMAGGLPSSISKEPLPKPMVELGGKPILWHIMKSLSEQGIKDFVICGGYKVEVIKEYFLDYYIYASDITVDLFNNNVTIHKKQTEDWNVTVVDTGINTALFKRLNMIQKYVGDDFLVVLGDCLADIDIAGFVSLHKAEGNVSSVALVKPTGRKQLISLSGDSAFLSDFDSSQLNEESWVNGDYYIFNKSIFEMLKDFNGDSSGLLRFLTGKGKVSAYKHNGYWTSIETMHDLVLAERLWNDGKAPWVKA